MAATINVEHADQVKRQDTIRVNPEDILPGRNARNPDGKSEAADYEATVIARALSIAQEGQLQPCGVRRDEQNRLILTFGYTRRDAVILLRKGFDAVDPRDGTTRTFHDPNALLWVKIDDCTEEEAFLRSIKENLERETVTDLQEAKQQESIRESLQWPDAQIARFYGYTNQNRVAALSKLLTLPPSRQKQVHEGKLALYAALETLKIADPAERETILDAALTSEDRVDGAAVKRLVRDAKLEAIEEATEAGLVKPVTEPKGGKGKRKKASEASISRNASDFKRFCDEVCDEKTAVKPKVKEYHALLKKWIEGGCADRSLWKFLNG